MTDPTCQVPMGDYQRRPCGKPAKGVLTLSPHVGKAACGVHLAAERRRIENRDRWDAERDQRNAERARAKAVADQFNARTFLGLKATAVSATRVEVDAEALMNLMTAEDR